MFTETGRMKKYWPIVCVVCLWFTLPQNSFSQAETAADSSRIIRVMTYNIWHGEKHYGDPDAGYESSLQILAEVIQKADPDLVALQEVDNRTGRSRGRDLISELALLTRMNPLFGATMSFDGGEYGLGILSKFSFQSSRLHRLHSPDGSEPRAALEAIVVIPSGDTVRFISTHFDHRETAIRSRQAEDVNTLFAFDSMPGIMAGDFNAVPGSDPIAILEEHWNISSSSLEHTAPSHAPSSKIDYIMYRTEERWRVIENRVIEEKVASDHNPVLSVFELL
jgi:endonuclease/exonuclease/phosphatase family metal-dependent hydrolase